MNQYHSSSTMEAPNTQSSQEDNENVIERPCRFYRQVTYNEQLESYVFVNTNARVPAEGCMYVIIMSLQKDTLGTTLQSTSVNWPS